MAEIKTNLTETKSKIPVMPNIQTDAQKKLAAQQEKDKQEVRGIFRFHEVPGGSMGFVFKKYKGDSVKRYDMVDGEIYTIPYAVAVHLNTNCWYPVHSFKVTESGKPDVHIGKKVRRCSFQSLEFMDLGEQGPSLYEPGIMR